MLYFVSVVVMLNISLSLMGAFERHNKALLEQHAKETGTRKTSSQIVAAAMQSERGYEHMKTKLPALVADDPTLFLAVKWGHISTRVFLIGLVVNLVLFYFAPALSPMHP